MILRFVLRVVLIAVPTAVCYALAEQFGSLTASLIWAGVAACACAVGTALLRTSPIGRITWRNRVAGYLIPWGWRLNGGRLWPVPIISWVVWMAIGAAVFLLRSAEEPSSAGLRTALFVAWVIDAAALMYVLGVLRQATPGSRVRPVWKIASAIAAILAVSVGLYLEGFADSALLVGGGPPAVVGGCAAVVVVFFLTIGRNTRWN